MSWTSHVVCVAAVTLCSGGVAGVELTPKNWEKRVRDKRLFIKFFAPWCGHCKKLKPDWDRLATDFKGSTRALVAEVDCTGKGKPICERNSVTGYPKLMWGTGSDLRTYEGERSYSQMKQFADEYLGASCGAGALDLCDKDRRELLEKFMRIAPEKLEKMIATADGQIKKAQDTFRYIEWNMSQQISQAAKRKEEKVKAIRRKKGLPVGPEPGDLELTPANWEARVAGRVIFVKFYAPWCGHCKALKPDWDRLMSDYAGTSTSLVAEVDCTGKGKELCEKHGITGYPRLMWGEGNELMTYKGGRQYEELKSFAAEHLGKTCSASNLDLCEEGRKAAMGGLAKESAEKRDAKARSAERAIEKAEQEYQDAQWNFTGRIDVAEEKRDQQIKAIRAQGLEEAKMVHEWNKKQPPGFWKAPASPDPSQRRAADFSDFSDRSDFSGFFERTLFEVMGFRVSVVSALALLLLAALLVQVALCAVFRRGPGKSCVLRHILTETEGESLAVKSRLEAGEDFAKVAAECSTCRSAQEGGSLGRRECGTMQPAIDAVCFSPATKLGALSGPVKTKFGFHLIVVDSREGVDEAAKETAKDK